MAEKNWWEEENASIAKCGHDDVFGYLLNIVCKTCADRGHKEVTRGH
jgi:hypothetical protein